MFLWDQHRHFSSSQISSFFIIILRRSLPHYPTTFDYINATILMIRSTSSSSDKSLNNHQDHRHTASQTTLDGLNQSHHRHHPDDPDDDPDDQVGLLLLRQRQQQERRRIISQESNNVYDFLSGVKVTSQEIHQWRFIIIIICRLCTFLHQLNRELNHVQFDKRTSLSWPEIPISSYWYSSSLGISLYRSHAYPRINIWSSRWPQTQNS